MRASLLSPELPEPLLAYAGRGTWDVDWLLPSLGKVPGGTGTWYIWQFLSRAGRAGGWGVTRLGGAQHACLSPPLL